MKSKNLLAILFSALMMLSGCITIEEHYNFKKNGSGTMSYVVDMKEMGEMLEAFSEEMEKEEGSSSSEEDDMGIGDIPMSELADSLKTVDGISKVKYEQDGEYYYKISYAFKNIEALNAAMNVLMSDKDQTTDHVFFKREGNKLYRVHNESAQELGDELADDEGGEEAVEMLKSMKYEMSFNFKEKLKSVESNVEGSDLNPDYKNAMSDDKKSYELKTDFSVVNEKSNALDLTFEFE